MSILSLKRHPREYRNEWDNVFATNNTQARHKCLVGFLSLRSLALVQFDNRLRTVPQSNQGNDLLEYEDREEPRIDELPNGLHDNLGGRIVDATSHSKSKHLLVECIVTEEIKLVEQTHEEQRIGNNVVKAENKGTLLVHSLVTLSHKRSTDNQKDEESSPVHLNPVAHDLQNHKQRVIVFLLRVQVRKGEIQRASAETIANHIQHSTEVRAYKISHTENVYTLIKLSRTHSVKSVQNVADKVKNREYTIDQPPFLPDTWDGYPPSKTPQRR